MSAAASTSPQGLAAGFTGDMRRVRSSPIYTLAILATAVMMLLLPLVYIALIVLVGWGVYWHATHNIGMFHGVHGAGSGKLVLIGYGGPLVAGVVCVLFMVKPLFAPRGTKPEPYVLEPSQEPVLFGFVEMLCRVMGAPVPRQIHANCDVNASAAFRRGLWSMLGSDLVLTIGLPLVSGMSLRQFTGVLAHEFGHFTQGVGMRASYIIYRINAWFARVAYDRDGWDEQLEEWAGDSNLGAAAIVVLLCRLLVGLTRLILRLLMLLAHALSCFMARQMEYDADLHEVRVVGSAAFAPAFERIVALSASQGAALAEARDKWQEKRLPDDLPALIRAVESEIKGETRAKIMESALKQRTGLFDTHPSLERRVRRAEKAAEEGIFRLEVPATALFRNFADVCRRASYLHYRAVLGEAMFNATFIPTRDVVGEHAAQVAAGNALERMMGKAALISLPIAPNHIAAPKDPRAALATLKEARSRMAKRQAEADAAAGTFHEAHVKLIHAHQGSTMLSASVKFMPGPLKLPAATREAVDHHERTALADQSRARATLDPYTEDARTRLTAALSILHVPGAEAKIKDVTTKQRTAEVLAGACRAAADALPAGAAMTRDMAALMAVLQNIRRQKDQQTAIKCAHRLAKQIARSLKSLRDRLGGVEYPYASASGSLTVDKFVVTTIPPPSDMGKLYNEAGEAMERLSSFYIRVLADLARLVEEVETAVGLAKPPGTG